MDVRVTDAGNGSTNGTAGSSPESVGFDDRGNILPRYQFSRFCNDVWTIKSPAAVEQYTKAPSRTCRSWVDEVDPVQAPSSAAFAILRDKEGYRFLKRVMRDDPPDWWINFQVALASLGELK